MEFMELLNDGVAKIKVIGVGGGGGNAVNNMVTSGLSGVTFVAANTDLQALGHSLAEHKIQLGDKLTKGLGAGANPQIGCDAAIESIDMIKSIIGEADMVFVTAGMGGGTGTGAAPVIARVAKELGALTVGVVTKPFPFEGKRRLLSAESGIAELRKYVDSLITIPNERLVQLAHKKATFREMLKKADEVLYQAVKGISDLLMVPGLINLDFADVKAVMSESGLALMGSGVASGESRAREAAMRAITSPLLEDVNIDGARGVLINVTCSPDLTIDEVSEAANIIHDAAHPDAQIFFGAVFDETVGDDLRITVIATGIDSAVREGDSANPANITPMPQRRPAQPAQGQSITTPIVSMRDGAGLNNMGHASAAFGAVTQPARPYGNPGGNVNVPTYLRKSEPTVGMSLKATGRSGHNPGEDDFIFDEDESEIPAFIRKQAN